MTDFIYAGRVGLQQRVFPSYRAAFFDTLAARCAGGLCLFAGDARPDEIIDSTGVLTQAVFSKAENRHFLQGELYFCGQPNILSWLENWDPDALIVEANPRYLNTPDAIRWMHARSRPVVGWGLGAAQLTGPGSALRMSRRRQFLGSLDAVIAYSQAGAEQYRQIGLPQERVFVAPNAVTARPSVALPARQPATRLSILFVGRLQARKRIDLLLRVCAGLPEALRPEVTIVGDGPQKGALQALAAELYPQAVFTGALRGAALAPYFGEANLFVLPGTGGLAVQQAMSYGLPVAVAEGDGTQSNLVTPLNGWQLIPGDADSLRSVLLTAAGDLPRLTEMGKESYRIVSEEINIDRMADVFVQALRTVSGE